MICAFIALILLVFESRDIYFLEIIGRVFLCGGALYYVFHQYQRKKSVTLLMALMAAVGIIYNPIVPPRFPNVGWVVINVVAMVLFYLISTRTPVEEMIGRHKEGEEQDS